MPTLKQKRIADAKASQDFLSRYTKDEEGFWVRNQKPSAAIIDEKRISDNLRGLLHSLKDAPVPDAE